MLLGVFVALFGFLYYRSALDKDRALEKARALDKSRTLDKARALDKTIETVIAGMRDIINFYVFICACVCPSTYLMRVG